MKGSLRKVLKFEEVILKEVTESLSPRDPEARGPDPFCLEVGSEAGSMLIGEW